LDDLVSLFGNSGWKGTPYGGNAWLPIACKVKTASDLLNSGKEKEASHIIRQAMKMPHNTGKVVEKLKELEKQSGSDRI